MFACHQPIHRQVHHALASSRHHVVSAKASVPSLSPLFLPISRVFSSFPSFPLPASLFSLPPGPHVGVLLAEREQDRDFVVISATISSVSLYYAYLLVIKVHR